MEQPKHFQPPAGFRATLTRGAHGLLRISFTFAVIAGAVLAVQFGAAELSRRAEAAPSPDPASSLPVQIRPVERLGGYTVTRAFIGQIETQRNVTVSFELPGRLADVFVDEGDHVVAGEMIARQDTALLEAEHAQLLASRSATRAQLTFAEQTVERNEELQRRGFAPQAGVDEAQARRDELLGRMAEINAGLDSVDIRLRKTKLQAPFAGRVTVRNVDGGEVLGASQPVISLVELSAPQIRVGLPLDIDETILDEVQVEVAGQVYPARMTSLRPDVDPVTRTRTALFAVDTDRLLTVGQTAQLNLQHRIAADGFWVPVASLKEGVRGQWTLLAVDEAQSVRAAQVEILHAESNRVYVRAGLPNGTPLIDVGPQRVTVGQRVIPNFSE